ncbi:MAG: ParB/RepB/Spo0J family partition protein [Pseudomonadota bacterium]
MSTAKKNTASAKRPKPALDLGASMSRLQTASNEVADNRFAIARQVTNSQPTALSGGSKTDNPEHRLPSSASIAGELATFDPNNCQVGSVYQVPLKYIDENQYGARHFYRPNDVDDIGKTMQNGGQDVAANGFVKDNRIKLIDGGTRLRAARSLGLLSLEVKIEAPLTDPKDQFKRSALLNDQRSAHSSLDLAYRMHQMMQEGIYSSNDDVAANVPGPNGNPLSKSQVSMYLRIARIPERLLQKMSVNDQTSTFTIAYEISGIFQAPGYAEEPEKYDQLAEDVIDEIQLKQLGKEQSKTLIASKLKGPKTRVRAETLPVKYADRKGTLKIFPSRGQLDLSFKGLPEDKLVQLRESVEKMLAGQMAL